MIFFLEQLLAFIAHFLPGRPLLSSSECRTTAAIVTGAGIITLLNFLPADNQIGLVPTNTGAATESQEDTFLSKCESFVTERQRSLLGSYFGNDAGSITRNIVSFVPAGNTVALDDNDPSCNRRSQPVAVDICRIALFIPTSRRSDVTLELWLPRDEVWHANSRRFLGTGNGGVDGCRCKVSGQLPLSNSAEDVYVVAKKRYQV
jgi:hypothetical protein